MDRISSVNKSLSGSQSGAVLGTVGRNSPDDVVIVAAYRTPLTKAGKGGLKDTAPEILLSTVLKGLVDKTKVDNKLIEDMVVGNCLQPGAGALIARAAQLMADFPVSSSCAAINRQCSSGIEACSIIAAKIKAGIINAGVGAGVESMTLFDMNGMVDPNAISDKLFDHETARNCLQGMGQTSEVISPLLRTLLRSTDSREMFSTSLQLKATEELPTLRRVDGSMTRSSQSTPSTRTRMETLPMSPSPRMTASELRPPSKDSASSSLLSARTVSPLPETPPRPLTVLLPSSSPEDLSPNRTDGQ